MAYQTTTAPDGIHIHVFGPVEGRRHDATAYRQSGLAQLLDRFFWTSDGHPLVIYGDPAYALSSHLICPFKGSHLSREEQAFNTGMSRVRESVEWGFADVTRNWAFLRLRHKILLEPTGLWYIVGTLLANARNCLYPNQISLYFGCPPPALTEYFVGEPLPRNHSICDVQTFIEQIERDMEDGEDVDGDEGEF